MVKEYKFTHTFFHPFEKTSCAFLNKWNTCKNGNNKSHINSIDFISQKLNKNELNLQRIICCKTPFSYICHTFENTIIDREKRTMTIQSTNINLTNIFKINETCVYKQDENNTTFTQIAIIESKLNIYFLDTKLENYMLNTFPEMSKKGVLIVEKLIENLSL